MPTQPPTPPPIYHTPTGDVAGVWSKSTGWHLPYTSTATAMPSQYAGQTRAYNPQTKTWEEMTWVDTVGYMSPYQMKGILEGTIGYSGDLGKIKKAYADIGGTFTKREEVKVKEPEPSVVMYQTKEGLITGYESPYLQQSIIFKKELSETEAKKEIQKLHLERGIAKTRAEQLAKGYLTAEISPFTPQALRESEIQRQTIEQTWRTKIAVPKLIEIFTKEREAKGIGTTWEGQPISISKEGAIPYIVSVPTTAKQKEMAEAEKIKYAKAGLEYVEQASTKQLIAKGLTVPLEKQIMAIWQYKKGDVLAPYEILGRYQEELRLTQEKSGIKGVIAKQIWEAPLVQFVALPYVAGVGLEFLGTGLAKISPILKLTEAGKVVSKIPITRLIETGVGVGYTGLAGYEIYKAPSISEKAMIGFSFATKGAVMFAGGSEAFGKAFFEPKVSQKLILGKYVTEPQGKGMLTKTSAKLITAIKEPFRKTKYDIADIKDITQITQEGKIIRARGVATISGQQRVILTAKGIARQIPKKDMLYTISTGKVYTKKGFLMDIAGKSIVTEKKGLLKGMGIVYGKEGLLGDYFILLKRTEAKAVPIKALDFSIGKKAQALLTLETLERPKVELIPRGELPREDIIKLGVITPKLSLLAGAIKSQVLTGLPKLESMRLLAPLTRVAQREAQTQKLTQVEKLGLKEAVLTKVDVGLKEATALKEAQLGKLGKLAVLQKLAVAVKTEEAQIVKTQVITQTTPMITPILTPVIPSLLVPPMILYGGQVKKGKKAKKSKLMFKFKAPKYEIMPLPDIISVVRTEATTWKKAHALYPTPAVKRAFARAVAERPFAWHFPTAEIVKKKWKGGLF